MPRNNDKVNKKQQPATKVKRKRTPVTVADILTRDDVNGIIASLNEVKPHITAAIVIYMDEDNVYHSLITDDTLSSTAVWMLEGTKLDLLNGDQDIS